MFKANTTTPLFRLNEEIMKHSHNSHNTLALETVTVSNCTCLSVYVTPDIPSSNTSFVYLAPGTEMQKGGDTGDISLLFF